MLKKFNIYDCDNNVQQRLLFIVQTSAKQFEIHFQMNANELYPLLSITWAQETRKLCGFTHHFARAHTYILDLVLLN